MATLSNNDIAEAIYLSSKDKSAGEQSLVISKITQFLFRKRLLYRAPEILSCLDKIINYKEGKVVAKVSSKEKLSENTKRDITHILKQRYSAQHIILTENLDEKLLGGFKIEVDDEVIDLTLKNKIRKLQEYLIKTV